MFIDSDSKLRAADFGLPFVDQSALTCSCWYGTARELEPSTLARVAASEGPLGRRAAGLPFLHRPISFSAIPTFIRASGGRTHGSKFHIYWDLR